MSEVTTVRPAREAGPGIRSRLDRARRAVREAGLAAFLVGPSPDLFWLTGYRALPLERLTMLVVGAGGDPVLIVPELEAPRARASGATDHVELITWSEDEDPIAVVVDVLDRIGVDGRGTVAVQDRLRARFLLALQTALPDADWTSGAGISKGLRSRKCESEIAALRGAGRAIDAVHEQVPDLLRPGRTEREVARDIEELILADHDSVNFVIVASGPNGASPHHDTGDRALEPGDAVVVDIGGTRHGYCSDMTRNYVLGTPPDGYRRLHETLEAAQAAGVAAVAPGATTGEVDAACRSRLDEAGYGEFFVHRTGHGIGVEEHEEPWIVAGGSQVLEPGMAFSVEPGIYVPGRYGARIEDIVVVTDEGAERLNRLDRDLVVVQSGSDGGGQA